MYNIGFEKVTRSDVDGFKLGFSITNKFVIGGIIFLELSYFTIFKNGERIISRTSIPVHFDGVSFLAKDKDDLFSILSSEGKKPVQIDYCKYFV